jgi:YD repeat-containing protein
VTHVTNPRSRITSITYDTADHVLTQSNAVREVDSYVYDDSGERSRIPAYPPVWYRSGTTTTATDYVHGRAWQVTTYAYMARNQMSGITYADSTTDAWTYDANGALATKTDGRGVTTTYSYGRRGAQDRH